MNGAVCTTQGTLCSLPMGVCRCGGRQGTAGTWRCFMR
jgi:hypothetical protein